MDLDAGMVRNGLLTFIVLLASLVVHEWAHAMTAELLGDDTPRQDGRLTLNPLVHIDLMGTVILPLFNIFVLGSTFSFIAWAKPVMVNVDNFKRKRLDDVLVTLAGPAANALIALVAIVVGSLLVESHPVLAELVRKVVIMNVGLAVFNMLPIPPLDGGIIFSHAVGLPWETFAMISRFSGIFLLIAINIKAFTNALGVMVLLASLPYVKLCGAISPAALYLIFP